MLFGQVIYCLLECILAAESYLGPAYLFKVDLECAYMNIWVRTEVVTSVDFIIPKETSDEEKLMDFHLFIPHYIHGFYLLFCTPAETVKERALKYIDIKTNIHSNPWKSLLSPHHHMSHSIPHHRTSYKKPDGTTSP